MQQNIVFRGLKQCFAVLRVKVMHYSAHTDIPCIQVLWWQNMILMHK